MNRRLRRNMRWVVDTTQYALKEMAEEYKIPLAEMSLRFHAAFDVAMWREIEAQQKSVWEQIRPGPEKSIQDMAAPHA